MRPPYYGIIVPYFYHERTSNLPIAKKANLVTSMIDYPEMV